MKTSLELTFLASVGPDALDRLITTDNAVEEGIGGHPFVIGTKTYNAQDDVLQMSVTSAGDVDSEQVTEMLDSMRNVAEQSGVYFSHSPYL